MQQMFIPHGAPIRDRKLLPVQPPGQVFGRNRELASMHLTLKARSSVFLSGPSGIGKTALAAILATAQIASNPGGVLWFSVVEDDLPLLVARTGRAYGVDTYSGDFARSIVTARALLEKQRPLVVLDGLIDLNAARDFARQCAAGVPLILVNESPGSGPWTPIALEPLASTDSQALFGFYAGLHESADRADIEALIKFLDNFPMTLELAARQVAVDNLTAAELLAMLPSSTGRDSQQVIMSLCFKRLDPAIQGLLLVLAGMFSGAASAELMANQSNISAAELIPAMRKLVTRGLARESMAYGQYVYTLQEVAQQYARSWLKNYQRLRGIEARALQSVLAYTERHAHPGVADHDRLAAEIENIVGAAAYATEHEQIGVLQRLIKALSASAGDFITARRFQPELAQLKKLATLLEMPGDESTEILPDRVLSKPRVVDDPSEMETQPVIRVALPEQPKVPKLSEPPPDVTATLPKLQPLTPAETKVTSPVTPTENIPAATVSAAGTAATLTSPPTALPIVSRPAPKQIGTAAPKPLKLLSRLQPPPQPQTSDSLSEDTMISGAAATVPLTPIDAAEVSAVTAAVEAAMQATPPTSTETPPLAEEDTENPTPRSLPNLEQQLVEARKTGNRKREAMLLQTLGQYYLDIENTEAASSHFRMALDAYDALNDPDGSAAVLDSLVMLAVQSDDVDGALAYATRGITLAEQIGDRSRLGRLQTRLGDVRLAQGNTPQAIEAYSQALATLRQTEDWGLIGLVMNKLGGTYLQQNQPQEAIQILEPALAIFRKEGRQDQEIRVLSKLGQAYSQLRQLSTATEHHTQALTLARNQSDLSAEATQLAALAHLRVLQSDHEGAIRYYGQALHVAHLLNDKPLQATYSLQLGMLLMDNTQTLNQAVQLLREADEQASNSESKRLLKRASQHLKRISDAGMTLPDAASSGREYAAKVAMN